MKSEDLINVLLVEDESTLAMIIKDTLEGQGFRIRLAKDGEEGCEKAKSYKELDKDAQTTPKAKESYNWCQTAKKEEAISSCEVKDTSSSQVTSAVK